MLSKALLCKNRSIRSACAFQLFDSRQQPAVPEEGERACAMEGAVKNAGLGGAACGMEAKSQ